MSALFLGASIRTIEREWIGALGGGVLMDRAAHAVADAAARLARTRSRGAPIVALVGPGNNGGDALAAAALLRDRGFPVHALALFPAAPAAEDALSVWNAWVGHGNPIEPIEALPGRLTHDPIVIDGLFGIGLARPLGGAAAHAVAALRDSRAPVVAVDIPSGLSADTGCVVGGADGIAVRALRTITMIADKPGLHTADALDHVGELEIASLDVEFTAGPGARAIPADGRLFSRDDARAGAPPRPRNSNKGSFGSVLVVGGAAGTTGAALLAARGAQAAGAGKVFVASPDERVFDPGQPQLMTRSLDTSFDDLDALCVGCGLGRSRSAVQALLRAMRVAVPVVLDADALNLVAEEASLARRLAAREAPTVLTPHPLEAARLLGTGILEVQSDRIASARELAGRFNATVILKGAGSIVCGPDRHWSVIDAGAPALATAGTGDVLAGVVAALLAQRAEPALAACLGAWLHGRAGEIWQLQHPAGAGLSAARLPSLIIDAAGALLGAREV